MRHSLLRAWAACALLLVATSSFAVSPVNVVIGSSRDGSLHDLQRRVDRFIGYGRVDVTRDYIGARPGDPDPFTWVNTGSRAVSVQLLDRKSPRGTLGWYAEGFGVPALDGRLDGVVLPEYQMRGIRTSVQIPATVTRFGFYVRYRGSVSGDGKVDGGVTHFTNRLLNDCGPFGNGAVHQPIDGDPQMLIYDVSRWLGPSTYLVACEASDSGCPVGMGDGESDNDYTDLIYLVSALGATPTRTASFTRLKALFR